MCAARAGRGCICIPTRPRAAHAMERLSGIAGAPGNVQGIRFVTNMPSASSASNTFARVALAS